MLIEFILLLALAIPITHFIDYRILKKRHFNSRKWDLNISCGPTDGGGINADIVKRDVPKFVLVESIYSLPFKDKQFKNTVCSHTMEHVDDPERFYRELRRVSENVVVLVPPVWDIAALLYFPEHKWQFITLGTCHKNNLPKRIRLPYGAFQRRFGQRVK